MTVAGLIQILMGFKPDAVVLAAEYDEPKGGWVYDEPAVNLQHLFRYHMEGRDIYHDCPDQTETIVHPVIVIHGK